MEAYEHLKYASVTKKGVVEEDFIKTWVRDKGIRKYNFMNNYPPPMMCPPDEFNTWTDFDVVRESAAYPSELSEMDKESCEAYLNHFRILLGSACEYYLFFFAQILLEPSVKKGIALILKGVEGAGKNRLIDLIKLMLGVSRVLETSRPEHDLYARFNTARLNKFIVVINEAGGRVNHANDNLLKDMITATKFTLEAKGCDLVEMNCYSRYIFTTNNDNVVKVSSDSRRWVVTEVSSKLKGNTEYFKELSRHIDNPGGRVAFYR